MGVEPTCNPLRRCVQPRQTDGEGWSLPVVCPVRYYLDAVFFAAGLAAGAAAPSTLLPEVVAPSPKTGI